MYIEASSSHVAEGQTLDLNCVVPGQAHAQVTWHKRGGSLPARHQVGRIPRQARSILQSSSAPRPQRLQSMGGLQGQETCQAFLPALLQTLEPQFLLL